MISKIYLWYTLSSNLWLFKGNSAKCGSILFVLQRTAVERNSGDSEKKSSIQEVFVYFLFFLLCTSKLEKKKKKITFFFKGKYLKWGKISTALCVQVQPAARLKMCSQQAHVQRAYMNTTSYTYMYTHTHTQYLMPWMHGPSNSCQNPVAVLMQWVPERI